MLLLLFRKQNYHWRIEIFWGWKMTRLTIQDPEISSDSCLLNRYLKISPQMPYLGVQGNDGTTIYDHNHFQTKTKINETRNFTLSPNANFYNLPTSPIASAVHIPTPLYDRSKLHQILLLFNLLHNINQIRNYCEKSIGPISTLSTRRIGTRAEILPSSYSALKVDTCDSIQVLCRISYGFLFLLAMVIATSWFWDNHEDHLDLFDCRNTEWSVYT